MLLGPNHPHPEKVDFVDVCTPFPRQGGPPEEKCQLESGLNQRDRATAGFVRVYTRRKPGKIFYWRGFPNEQEESSTEGKKGGRQKTATDLLELMPPSPIGVWRGRREIASTATACAVGGLRVSLSAPVNFATALLRRSVLERDLPSARRRARYRRWRRGHRQCGRQSCIRRSHGR